MHKLPANASRKPPTLGYSVYPLVINVSSCRISHVDQLRLVARVGGHNLYSVVLFADFPTCVRLLDHLCCDSSHYNTMSANSFAGLYAVCGSFMGLSALTVGLRFYSRARKSFSAGIDDYTALFGVVSTSNQLCLGRCLVLTKQDNICSGVRLYDPR